MPPAPRQAVREPSSSIQQRKLLERRVVGVLLVASVLIVIVLAAVSVRATMYASDVRARASGALSRASLQQMEFHTANRRFALWGELEERGMRLPPAMSVDATSATSSHWYLRLRDDRTGMTCDRVGLLTDPPGDVVVPTCTQPD